ncbi:MAG: molybdenum cofactor biosynthesis protein MoaE [Synechococcus sp. SB0668_bin_15]|nr:molybdenum cofactor biosynthesis protein MoaE [Synechococcus sp. SB0668_bin_15]MYC49788.1 molybdenum cofactor biosynthesis protein MoaE [Synechococcus sp. SB0662_bin_14]
MNIAVRLLENPFDPLAALSAWGLNDAAQAQFIGRVRGTGVDGAPLRGLWLEHYPGMTEAMLNTICREELVRHGAGAALVWHRVGALAVGESIVLVATAGDRRGAALASCQAILEALKHRAPFWKKELAHTGERWVPGNTPYGVRTSTAG